MQRAIIIAKGRVQKVGYRDFVAEIANGLNIGGIAKNLPDGTIRIIAEAEKDVLEGFIPLIQPRDDPMIKVTGVDVRFEEPTGEFEYFDVEYEDFDKEGFERIGIAAVYLKQLNKGQGKMLDKQDQMLDKQDQTIEIIKQGNEKLLQKQDKTIETLNNFREETNKNFTKLGDKIDKGFAKTDQNFTTLGEKIDSGFAKTDQNFTTLRDDYGRISKDLTRAIEGIEKMAVNIEKLTKAVVALVEKSGK